MRTADSADERGSARRRQFLNTLILLSPGIRVIRGSNLLFRHLHGPIHAIAAQVQIAAFRKCCTGFLIGVLFVGAANADAVPKPTDGQHTPASAAVSLSSFARELLGTSDEQLARYEQARQQGLLEIAAVHLPVNPPGDCDHYGWPVTALAGDTLVLMHRRIPGHNPQGAGGPHEKMSYGIALRSTDGGHTWSEPYDLRDAMRPEDRLRGGLVPLSHRFKFEKENKSTEGYKVHLHAIGATRDGGVVAINNHGVFRSDDQGVTWKHFSKALRDDTFPYEIINLGPNIIDHPQYGLMVFGNWFGSATEPNKLSNSLVVLRSRDGGESWNVLEDFDVGFPQYEPAALLHDDSFLLVTRDQSNRTLGLRAVHRHMTWKPGSAPQLFATNLEDPRYLDTVELSFNPLTKRLELLRSERYRMEFWLWSLDPTDWAGGQWRRECRMLARSGQFYSEADGFHPTGAVNDPARGVQHIFFYTGHPNGPAGVFRITRTLDTERLTKFLNDP